MHVDLDGDADHDGDTSYIAVVDKDRNMVSFEPSLHSVVRHRRRDGKPGFIFNCRGDYYSLVRGRGQCARARQAPAQHAAEHAGDEGRPAVTWSLGSPGGDDQVMRTMQTLLNMVDFGMNIQQAIEAPRWSRAASRPRRSRTPCIPARWRLRSRIPESTRQALISRGHKLRVDPPWSLGSNAGIVIDMKTGVLSAGADPRVDAYAWAW